MDEYQLPDDPVPEDLLKEAERLLHPTTTHTIYFNKDTGEIYAISNEHLDQYDNFFEVNSEEINHILQDGDSTHFKVEFVEGQPTVVLKPTNELIAPSLIKVGRVDNWESELTIEQYPYLKKWGFQLRPDQREKLKSSGLHSKLEFFIVDSENRNFILNIVTFNFQRLCDNEKVFISFSHHKEDKDVEVYTKALFKTIGLTTLYDTKD